MDKDIPVINCDTKQLYRSKSTNKTYATKEEFLQSHSEQDLSVDTTVTISNEGLELFKKVMGQK
jgi:predicted house-cleaning NTP pyrophosphatase (Maf/HAM1 superfamily)|tara:strand:+ start:33 stop:224 length:192 start_codon:yes stop_codon:yes gene_type:complete